MKKTIKNNAVIIEYPDDRAKSRMRSSAPLNRFGGGESPEWEPAEMPEEAFADFVLEQDRALTAN